MNIFVLSERPIEAAQMLCNAVYIGPDCGWNVVHGDTALIRPSDKSGVLLAQFDDFSKSRDGLDLAYGWHEFPIDQFKVEDNGTS